MENRQSRTWPVFAPFEVVIHNKPQDCWVSLLGKVLDITPLIKEHENEQSIKPLIAMAGKDISHWFDNKTGEIRHYVHPETGANVPYCPYGPLPDVAETLPTPTWRPLSETPWWKNDKFQIGLLSQRIRPIRIINMLTLTEVTINVCFEDTFHRILERYLMYNSDARSYTWRYMNRNVDMTKTMNENGISDDRQHFAEIGLPQNFYIPSVFLYYNDDLKFAKEYENH